MPTNSAIAVDLGGTHLRCARAVGRSELTNVTRQRIRSFHEGLSPAAIWDEILQAITAYSNQYAANAAEQSAPLAISFPGPLDEQGRIVNAPTVTGRDGQVPDLRAELARRTGRRVYLLNDVSAAAFYLARECCWGRFMVVTISSGIGSKICHRTRAGLSLFDQGPYAGEIGHLTVDPSKNAPLCDCGGRGHLGAIASGRGVERLARQRAKADPALFATSICKNKFGATPKSLSNENHFAPAVREADPWALSILREATEPLARVLNTVVLALGLQGILVIGGFAFGIGPIYLDMLHRLTRANLDYSAIDLSPDMLRFGNMTEEACLRGAAEYAFTQESQA